METITVSKSAQETNNLGAHKRQSPHYHPILIQQHLLQINALRQRPITILYVSKSRSQILNIIERKIVIREQEDIIEHDVLIKGNGCRV